MPRLGLAIVAWRGVRAQCALAMAGLCQLTGACLPPLSELQNKADAAVDSGANGDSSNGSDAASLCVGPHPEPDGTIQAGEECDDGNQVDGDGCSTACRIDCTGEHLLTDDRTCYFLLSLDASPGEAEARCLAAGNQAHPLTIRSDDEATLIQKWLETTPVSAVLLGLRLDKDNATWLSTAGREPGWSATKPCPGCYARWETGEPNVQTGRRSAVLSRARGWKWVVAPSVGVSYALVCERERPGLPENECKPPCDPSQIFEFTWKDPVQSKEHTYRIQYRSASPSQAATQCKNWGGSLLVLDSEAERKTVVRYGPQGAFFIGLARDPEAGTWIWANGESDTSHAYPIPWSSLVPIATDTVAAIVPNQTFDTNLVQGEGASTMHTSVCRK